jgi:protein SCO1/2
MSALRALLLSILTVVVTACSASAPTARQYELVGQILAVRAEDGEVLIKHGDIKGFMPGMTMPFKVRDRRLLEGKQAGDLVTASLTVANTEAWLTSLEKTGSAPLTEAAALPPASFVTPVAPGAQAPDAALTDHLGQPLTLAAWRGSAVAVTFIYVRCPLPQFCPLLDSRFADVQRVIKADTALVGRARLLSVSFDPDADTIDRLRGHARRLEADDAVWRFATAPREIVDRFAAQFGVNVIREPDQTITHNMRTTVIGPDGRVVSVYEGSEWTVSQLVDAMRRTLH